MPTLDLIVGASADDAEEKASGASFLSTGAGIKADSNSAPASRYNCGMRFTNVTIPQGATITAAYLTVRCTADTDDDANLDIHAEAVDNAVDFAMNADVTSRARSAASAAWVQDALGVADVNTPPIASVIQEIVNRAGWASGNALCVLFVGRSDLAKPFRIRAYDGSTTACARLHVEYSTGGGGLAMPVAAHHFRQMGG